MSEQQEKSALYNLSIWNAIENCGVKLPYYIKKLLLLSGYDNLQCLMKLVDAQLIQEVEQFATNN